MFHHQKEVTFQSVSRGKNLPVVLVLSRNNSAAARLWDSTTFLTTYVAQYRHAVQITSGYVKWQSVC